MLTIATTDVEAVAENLPGTWTVDQEYPSSAKLTRADGLVLILSIRDKKVMVMLGGVPQEHLRYNEERPKINVTLTPARSRIVAKDIARRLLPSAEAMHAIVQERIRTAYVYDTERSLLAAQLGVTVDEHGKARVNEGAIWGDVIVYSDTVTMSLHMLTPEQAVAIMSLLRSA